MIIGPSRTSETSFIEIAAEPDNALINYWPHHPFTQNQAIRHGDPLTVKGPVVIFANEWLDALPFNRLVFRGGKWREKGVLGTEKGQLKEVLLDRLSEAVSAVVDRLPQTAPEGYQLDWPLAAEKCP